MSLVYGKSARRRAFAMASAWLIPLVALCGPKPLHAAVADAGPLKTVGAPKSAGATLVLRGRYVAVEADCSGCHTAAGGRPYAGGYPLKSPFGIIYGSNITPDTATGIGSWSKAQFERSLRLGRSKDGSYLYPAMPYENYTKMTAADMDALWAYMRTVRPVKNTPPKNTLPFPFTVRTGLAVWQSLYFTPGPFAPNPRKDARWNRGSYLVQAMGHCGQCHTPRNEAQAMQTRHPLGGADIEGWFAPDISGDPASELRHWTAGQIAAYLKTGLAPNNANAFGPMQETVHDSLSKMTASDLKAVAAYLEDQPDTQAVSPEKARWTDEHAKAGRNVYADNCLGCHQSNGKGIAGSVPALAGDGAVTAAEPYDIIMAMLEGLDPRGTYGAMGSFAKTLNDEQIADVANYVRTAWGNDAIPNATPWGVSTWRNTAGKAHDESHQMLCPDLAVDVMRPALAVDSAALKLAATDAAAMSKLVGDYRAARPRTSSAQVVEALSTAYCRAVAADKISQGRMSAQIADFAQQVAVTLVSLTPPRNTAKPTNKG